MHVHRSIIPVAVTAALLVASCAHQPSPELLSARAQLQQLQAQRSAINYTEGSYEYFVSHNGYPVTMNIFKNKELMAKANRHSKVVICLAQQRGRLYVDNQVAADWPVSTGISGRETPPGHYSVLEKKPTYASNRYGYLYNEKGRCINSNADIFVDAIPEGGKFVGSSMPYWQRLTWDGVGMHIGKVIAGRRLSHGCIRTPREMAVDLYNILGIGSKVSVLKDIEAEFPARDAMAQAQNIKELDRRIRDTKYRVDTLTMREFPEGE